MVTLTLHGVLLIVLTGICAFDDGRLADPGDCVLPLSLLALPGVLALVGLIKGERAWIVGAAVICAALGLVTLTGAGFALLSLAILYAVARPPVASSGAPPGES